MCLTPPSTSNSPVSQYPQFCEMSSSSSDTSCPLNRLPSCYGSSFQQVVSGASQSDLDSDSHYHHGGWFAVPQRELLSPFPMGHGSTAWVTPDGLVAGTSTASSSSVEPDALHADFYAFAGYDSCLPAPYQTHDAYMSPSRSRSVHEPSLSSASQSWRAPSIGARPPYGYLQGPSESRFRVEGSVSSYDQGYEPQSYSTAVPPAAAYQTGGAPFASNLPSSIGASGSTAWPKEEYEVLQVYSTPQNQLPDLGPKRRLLKTNKAKRPTRKHISKEEANFQCEVIGCGKFFTRRYNCKLHVETHDEKREYPFTCTVDGCTKKFVRKTDLQRHHESVHMKQHTHKCDYCGSLFTRKDSKKRHMEDVCPKRFDIKTPDLQGLRLLA
ncbi:Cell wall transcription factor ACE2 [Fusarium oxysporum f. sp. rapae]|uniref:Cell wall transcription factor ACE2 n=1 Tax=Fusarium oxysporum f. sp. rapae TaxID=485398 RepID=A0A8J5NJB5_FUSOX|nr:Cell wall transcription factor ACE2 [Fusarium oxysporum f. sp. rapae]